MMKKVLNILIFLLLNSNSANAQQLTPPIHNFSSMDYGAASQNWDIDVDKNGIIYAANNQGLLSFDGQQWELHPLERSSIIRSVYAKEDRIYTGSYQEFGYWSRSCTGDLEYTSLTGLFGDYQLQSEEFWEILSLNDVIYFRSFGAIYRYENDMIRPVKNVVTNHMTVFQNRLLVAVSNSGLYFLDKDGEMEPLPAQEKFQNKTIIDVAVQGEKLLIGTRDELYEFNGKTCRIFPDRALNEDLRRFELNHILVLNEREIVLGTVKNGILHYKIEEGKYRIYNRNNGLQNNTVLGMAKKDGMIWLGLDNGIDHINLDSPLKYFTDETGELGAVYDLEFFEDQLYLASNTGVYEFGPEGIEIVEGAEGHTWNLEVIGDNFFANHNTGTYRIDGKKFLPVEERTGSFQVVPVPGDLDRYLIANYTGINFFSGSEKVEVENVEGVNFPVKEVIFENRWALWAAHPYEGIYKIDLEPDYEKVRRIRRLKSIGGKERYRANLFRINNQLAILNNGSWYKYNSFLDTLEAFEELRRFEGHKLLREDENGYWFAHKKDNALVFSNFKDEEVIISSPEIRKRLVKDNERMIRRNDSIYYIALNDGFAIVNLRELYASKETEKLSSPFVFGFSDLERKYDLRTAPKVPYSKSRNLTIKTALPVSDAAGLRYELIGTRDTLSGRIENGGLSFQNLAHGPYRLELFALSPQNLSSASTSFEFLIRPPWYLSNLMKLGYFLLFLTLVGVIYWFNQLKLKKQHLLLEQKFEKEHQERLNQLEKERLMNEITLKRKELANTTMIAAKKNEVLMEILGELNKDKNNFSNQFRLKHIMKKINRAVKNKDEWQVFETNFNELHEDFFKDLLDAFPKLSNKDLKLCSYLKMNLTSKEIAPLMGISVRGVEVHRYRLRRKMELDKKENLSNFLIKNF